MSMFHQIPHIILAINPYKLKLTTATKVRTQLIQLIIIKHIKVVSIDGLLALLAAFHKQTCYFHYFMYLSIFLFVEN